MTPGRPPLPYESDMSTPPQISLLLKAESDARLRVASARTRTLAPLLIRKDVCGSALSLLAPSPAWRGPAVPEMRVTRGPVRGRVGNARGRGRRYEWRNGNLCTRMRFHIGQKKRGECALPLGEGSCKERGSESRRRKILQNGDA